MTAAAPSPYVHATAVALGETGLLLRGPSGCGKSALALSLIARFRAQGDFARLVGDDRVRIDPRGGRLIARPHPTIAGVIEARGLGLLRVEFEPACVLRAIVDISAAGEAPPRYPEDAEKRAALCGIELPRLAVESCSDVSVAQIIFFIQRIMTI